MIEVTVPCNQKHLVKSRLLSPSSVDIRKPTEWDERNGKFKKNERTNHSGFPLNLNEKKSEIRRQRDQHEPSSQVADCNVWGLGPSAQRALEQVTMEEKVCTNAVIRAEVRTAESIKQSKYSIGDRCAYIGDRVSPQKNGGDPVDTASCYYALTQCGPSQVFVHGGQHDTLPALSPDKAIGSSYFVNFDTASTSASIKSTSFALPVLVGHSIVCYRNNYLIMYGGCGREVGNVFSDLFSINIRTGNCTKVKKLPPQPPGRARHAACIYKSQMVIYGGYDNRTGTKLLDDFWTLHIHEAKWERLDSRNVNSNSLEELSTARRLSFMQGPRTRYGHHLAAYKDWVYLAFGSDECRPLSDIWAYHMTEQHWDLIEPKGMAPTPRLDCAATTFGGEKWIFHGGLNPRTNTLINTFYEFNFRTHEGRQLRVELTGTPTKILPALRGHGIVSLQGCGASGSARNLLLVFGGVNRVASIANVIYAVTDTGKSPGQFFEENACRLPFVPLSESARLAFKMPSVNVNENKLDETGCNVSVNDDPQKLVTMGSRLGAFTTKMAVSSLSPSKSSEDTDPPGSLNLKVENTMLRERIKQLEFRVAELESGSKRLFQLIDNTIDAATALGKEKIKMLTTPSA